MKNLIYFILLVAVAQILIWYVTNGQFISNFFKKNTLLISFIGVPITYLVTTSTKYGFNYFEKLWPIRLTGFAIGIVVFTILTSYYMNEFINLKTIITIFLCFLIILIQVS